MVDTTQILLVTVVTVLTIILSVIGVYVVFILQEFKRTLEKTNKILDDVEAVSGGVRKTVSGASGLVAGVKAGMSLVNVFSKKDKDEEKNKEKDNE